MRTIFCIMMSSLLLFGCGSSNDDVQTSKEEKEQTDFVFVDGNGKVIKNGATIIVNEAQKHTVPIEDGKAQITYFEAKPNIKIKNVSGTERHIKLQYQLADMPEGKLTSCFEGCVVYEKETPSVVTNVKTVKQDAEESIETEWTFEQEKPKAWVLSIQTVKEDKKDKTATTSTKSVQHVYPTIYVKFEINKIKE